MQNKIKDALLGLAVGDALGVPVEFLSRNEIAKNPITAMRAYGTHNQPAGTWSDDSSLTFCLAESLCNGYNLKNIADNFVKWYDQSYWTAHNEVFDIGIATRQAIQRLKEDYPPLLAGGKGEMDNGNGSLMRILPLLFYIKDKNLKEKYHYISQVSSITHAHIRSFISCFIYLEFAAELLNGADKFTAYENMKSRVKGHMELENFPLKEIQHFDRILNNNIQDYPEIEIIGSGYVLHCLEAALFCFLTTETYGSAVLKAVNLGDDTDTTAAVTGGLAGLYYGSSAIPADWLNVLARREDIEDLADWLEESLSEDNN